MNLSSLLLNSQIFSFFRFEFPIWFFWSFTNYAFRLSSTCDNLDQSMVTMMIDVNDDGKIGCEQKLYRLYAHLFRLHVYTQSESWVSFFFSSLKFFTIKMPFWDSTEQKWPIYKYERTKLRLITREEGHRQNKKKTIGIVNSVVTI